MLELKNPAEEKADLWAAYNQLQTHKTDIPDLFIANVLLVIRDGVNARVGSLSADRERFQRWRTIDSDQQLDPLGQHRDLETLVRGVFDPRRFLDFLHFFCLFEEDGRIIKKITAYHQFHAVRAAVERVVQASRPSGDRKGGVVWHTQGAGKSIEMACLAGMLLLDPRLGNPTLANRPSGGILFTTIQKFATAPSTGSRDGSTSSPAPSNTAWPERCAAPCPRPPSSPSPAPRSARTTAIPRHGATVPIYYESRLARLALKDPLLSEVDAQPRIDEVAFQQGLRALLLKGEQSEGNGSPGQNVDYQLQQLLSEALVSEGVTDILQAAGLQKPDISIFSEEFLADIAKLPQKNLAVELLQRLLRDEVKTRFQINKVKQKRFSEMLQASLVKYANRSVEATQVIEELIAMAREFRLAAEKAQAQELRNNVSIDWQYEENVRARLRTMIKALLKRYKYPPDKEAAAIELVIL